MQVGVPNQQTDTKSFENKIALEYVPPLPEKSSQQQSTSMAQNQSIEKSDIVIVPSLSKFHDEEPPTETNRTTVLNDYSNINTIKGPDNNSKTTRKIQSYGYGGYDESEKRNFTPSMISKQNWSRYKCITIMCNVLIQMKEMFFIKRQKFISPHG